MILYTCIIFGIIIVIYSIVKFIKVMKDVERVTAEKQKRRELRERELYHLKMAYPQILHSKD